jgi:hypothetical protein
MATPSTLSYGTVTGQFLVSASDSADADTLPDAVPASGTVTFTPSAGVVLDYGTTPNPTAILRKPIVSTLDAQGYITGPDGTRGIKLIATDNPNVKPVGWTWVATYSLEDAEGNALRTLTTQPFFVPSNETTDLVIAMPIEESKGVFLSKGDKGDFATISVGSVSVGTPSVSINQVDGDAEVSFVLPVNNLEIGTVLTGDPVDIPTGAMVYRGLYGGDMAYQNFESGTIPFPYTSSHTPSVVANTNVTFGTSKALTFFDIGASTTSTIDFDVNTSGTIAIRYDMQTEANYDLFKVFVDGVEKLSDSGTKSSQEFVYVGTPGTHTVRLQFSKDGSQDGGYDNIRIMGIGTSAATAPYTKGSVVVYGGTYYVATKDYPDGAPSDPASGWDDINLYVPPAPTAITGAGYTSVTTNIVNAGSAFKNLNNISTITGTVTNNTGADVTGPILLTGLQPAYQPNGVVVFECAYNTQGVGTLDTVRLVAYPPTGSYGTNFNGKIALAPGQVFKAGAVINLNAQWRSYYA